MPVSGLVTQLLLAVAAALWTLLLAGGTGVFLWIAGNVVYSILALSAFLLLATDGVRLGRIAAGVGLLVFLASNGVMAVIASSTGGAWRLIIPVCATIACFQFLALLQMRTAPQA